MTAKENEQVVKRFYAEVINDRRLDAIDELVSEDFVHNGIERGRAGQRRVYEAFLSAFPDLQTDVIETVAAGDRVAIHRRWTGTHLGVFETIEPTGRTVDFESTAILTLRGGVITEYCGVLDLLRLMAQIGAAPQTSF